MQEGFFILFNQEILYACSMRAASPWFSKVYCCVSETVVLPVLNFLREPARLGEDLLKIGMATGRFFGDEGVRARNRMKSCWVTGPTILARGLPDIVGYG